MAVSESTTKIKMDISDLKKGIQDATRQIKLANAQFKAASAGMDDWSKTADGLSAKIKQTDTVLKNQKTILASYEKQLDLIVKEYGENSKEADNMRIKIENQKAAVTKTEKELKSYEKQLDEVGKETKEESQETEKLEKNTEENTEAIQKASEGYSVMKAAIANLIAEGIKQLISGLKDLADATLDSYKEFDKGYDAIIKATGASGEALEEMRDTYKSISKTVVADSETIGSAIGEVNTRFGVSGEQLEDLSTKYIKFSKLNNTDVVSSIDSTQKALSAYGLTVEDASDYLDALNKTAQDTGVDVDTLSDGIVQNATAFQEMGLSISQATIFMGQMEKSGANSETVMTGLKKALKNATAEGVPLNDALSDLQDTILNGSDGVDGLTRSYELFGKSGDQIYNAVRKGSLSFEDLAESVDASAGSIDKTFAATMDGYDQFELMVQGIKTDLGDELSKVFKDNEGPITEFLEVISELVSELIEGVADGLPEIIEAIQSIDLEQIKGAAEDVVNFIIDFISFMIKNGPQVIAAVKGIVAGFIAFKAATFIGSLISTFTTFFGVIQSGQGIMAALNAVMALNPATIIITAIAALTGAFIYLWNTSESFREFWKSLWAGIQEIAGKAKQWLLQKFEEIKEGLQAFWEKILAVKNFIVNAWEILRQKTQQMKEKILNIFLMLKNGITTVVNAIKTIITNIFTAIRNFIITAITTVKNTVVTIFTVIKNTITNTITAAKNTVVNLFTRIRDFIKNSVTAAKNTVVKVFTRIRTAISNAITKAKEKVDEMVKKIKEFLKFEGLKKTVEDIFNAIKGFIKDPIEAAKNAVDTAVSKIKEFLSFDGLKDTVEDIFDAIKGFIKDPIESAKSAVDTAASKISEFLSFSGLKTTVKNLFESIGSLISDPIETAKSTVSSAVEKIKGLFPIKLGKIFSGIKLPHFKISGGKAPWGIGGQGTKPSISIEWYARGGVLNGAHLIGAGENGAEAIVPLERNRFWIAKTARELRKSLQSEGVISGSGAPVYNYNFTQNNTSPKALSRLEIYRQTRNQLSFARGV